MNGEKRDVLKHYVLRLHQSARRSGLLYAFPTRTIKRLDITRLEAVEPTLPQDVLEKLISREDAKIQFDLDVYDSNEGRSDEHASLYHVLRNGLARTAEAFKRETGVRSLWLAYPLFHAIADKEEGEDQTSTILAPVFLWPIRLEIPLNFQGRICIARDEDAGGPKYNKSLDLWITDHLAFTPEDPRLDDFAETSLDELETVLRRLYGGLRNPPPVSLSGPPQPIPNRDVLRSQAEPSILHAGVIGLIQWENQAIIRDFEALQDAEELSDLVGDYLTGARRETSTPVVTPPETDRFLVTETDPSQEQAVWRSRAAPGVVVHGPPGTGKSQTIVNIVADALASGQRVLVVCQKRAAIDVVAERLKARRLAELFCVVHDSESDRAGTILAIKDQIATLSSRLEEKPVQEKRARLSLEITSLEGQLDDYCRALNERGETGLSYSELLASTVEVFHRSGKQQPDGDIKDLFADKALPDLLEMESGIKAMGSLWDEAKPNENIWRHRKGGLVLDLILQDAIRTALSRIRDAETAHAEFVKSHGVGLPFPCTPSEFSSLGRDWHQTVSAAIAPERVDTCVKWLKEAKSKGVGVCEVAERRLAGLDIACSRIQTRPAGAAVWVPPDGLTVTDGKGLLEDLRCVSWARRRWWRRMGVRYRKAGRSLRRAGFWQEIQTENGLANLKGRLESWIDPLVVSQELARMNVMVDANSGHRLVSAVERERWGVQYVRAALAAAEVEPWFTSVNEHLAAQNTDGIREDLERLSTALERAGIAVDLENRIADFGLWLESACLEPLKQRCRDGESLGADIESLEDGFQRLGALDQLDHSRKQWEGILGQTLRCLEANERKSASRLGTGDRWWAVVQLSAFQCWRERHEASHPVLNQLTQQQYEANRRRLGDTIKAKRELEPLAILDRWRQQQATRTRSHFSGVLVSRGRNSKRLREVVELGKDIGLFDFRPCWLTNPNTACQIFPLLSGFFDIVIFDEASQCPVEQAIAVIHRAKRVVVAGDEKQLPPTSFFKSSFSFGADEESEETQGEVTTDETLIQERIAAAQQQQALRAEDLLEASKPLLQESLLQVHYRSEHESLIQFSNHAFYSGQLLIPPSIRTARDSEAPLVLIETNGVYDNKSNLIEARRVIEVLRDLWLGHGRADGNPTVGVVTFNEVQRDLIDDLLHEEAAKDRAFRGRYEEERNRQDGQQDVGFFVKNLESVQGDERDIMVFSTTFGLDPQGRFRRFFGPLNQLGGERRLNVAITRAKRRNYLVTSMPLLEISERYAGGDIGPGGSVTGRDYLHGYMQYVRAVWSGDGQGQGQALVLAGKLAQSDFQSVSQGAEESPFETDVREAIESLGYGTAVQVGDGGFRIDIAVLHPKTEFGYLLGVECDGKTYHSGWSARARDVWRQQILERRGWNIHRIWSTNWWLNRESEIKKIKSKLAGLARK
jgi:very-short-patch-repair endonuclease